jgi:hypothetical protein
MRSMPREMWQMLGSHKMVKEAWEVVQTMRLGADRVKDINAQKLLKEFKNIQFKEGETIDDFGMRITNLVANLKALGETVEDTRVVKKFLRVVPPRFISVIVSIEMFCDLKTLTVELIRCLRAAEERSSTRRRICCWWKWTVLRNTSTVSKPVPRRATSDPVVANRRASRRRVLMAAPRALSSSHPRARQGRKDAVAIGASMATGRRTANPKEGDERGQVARGERGCGRRGVAGTNAGDVRRRRRVQADTDRPPGGERDPGGRS